MTALYQLTADLRQLQDLIDLNDGDVPEQALVDTLEGIEGAIHLKAQNVGKFIRNQEALAEAIEESATAQLERAKRVRRRVDALRSYLLTNMQASGISRIEAPEFVLSVRQNPPAVVVVDEASIPPAYIVTPPPAPPPQPRPDKRAIAAALKDGIEVPGARLEQGYRLEIRT